MQIVQGLLSLLVFLKYFKIFRMHFISIGVDLLNLEIR